MDNLTDYPPEYHTALSLLLPIWRGMSSEHKRKYARNIWNQFEDNLRAAAYTTTLSKFYNNLSSRLQIELQHDAALVVVAALTVVEQRKLLRQIREEAATLVLMVRLENDKRREEWEAKRAQREVLEERLESEGRKELWT